MGSAIHVRTLLFAILEVFVWGRGPTALGYSLSWLCFVVWASVAAGSPIAGERERS